MTTTAAKARYEWIDVGKGFSIVMVVLLHVSTWFSNSIFQTQTFWLTLSSYAAPIRMPLFFLISGLLFSSSLNKSFVQTWPKTIGLLIFHAGWTALWSVKDSDGSVLSILTTAAWAIIVPSYFWYIWALPLFCMIVWLANRGRVVSKLAILLVAGAAAIGAGFLPADMGPTLGCPFPVMLASVAANFVWFCCGLYFRSEATATVDGAKWNYAAIAAAMYIPLVAIVGHFHLLLQLKWLIAPVALFGALQILGLIDTRSIIARGLGMVGRLTLPVYIFHIIGITVLSKLFAKIGAQSIIASTGPWSELILVPVIALTLVVVSRVAGRVLEKSLWFTVRPMQAPKWLSNRSLGKVAAS